MKSKNRKQLNREADIRMYERALIAEDGEYIILDRPFDGGKVPCTILVESSPPGKRPKKIWNNGETHKETIGKMRRRWNKR